ncbi:MAG: hypothetical protein HYR63_25645 [Proteobacteria bacterium]|nr:hypothetical protein [Pseudomonadota bacterium]MBI3497316.1 hypothetical protein [Pseudomonadota bacterium]
MPPDHLPRLLEIATAAAQSTSDLILSAFRKSWLTSDRKADGSPVTEIDRQAEERIRRFLRAEQPEDWPILGEELGGSTSGSRYRWLIDPIDGTLSYVRGIPMFGTLIAFEDTKDERTLVGVIHLPAFAETYAAARGLGATCNGTPLRIAEDRELRDSIVSAPDAAGFRIAGLEEAYLRLRPRIDHLRGYADCWTHAMVTRGALDAAIEPYLNRWDIAATEVLIEEAGGKCLTRKSEVKPGSYAAIFGRSPLVDEIARIMNF